MQIQETESRYPVKRSALMLTKREREAALALLQDRPAVIPHTRVIPIRSQAVAWFKEVSEKITELGIPAKRVGAFCDVAGVPD
jgi:hypothetical protein